MAVILIIKQSSKATNSLLASAALYSHHRDVSPSNHIDQRWHINVKNVISNSASCNEVLRIDLRPLMSLLGMYLSLFKNQREGR